MYAKGMKLPEGKQCAAFITIDLAAEFFWISLDERAKHMPKTLSLGQYGMTHGRPRMLDLLDEFGIKATFFVPGKTAEVYPDAIREVAEPGATRLPATATNTKTSACWNTMSRRSASARLWRPLKRPAAKSPPASGPPSAI